MRENVWKQIYILFKIIQIYILFKFYYILFWEIEYFSKEVLFLIDFS